MEYVAVFEEQVTLTPKDLRGEVNSIDNILEKKLRTRLEGRCSRNGYVIPDGISIISRSMGMIERGRFTGNLLFHVQAEGKVLNPPDGTIVSGEVIRKNKMGLYVEYAKAIRIIIPRDLNIGNDEFEGVEVGEMVQVEIKKSRFQVNDEYILSVGLFNKRLDPAKKEDRPLLKAAKTIEEVPEAEEEAEAEAEEEAEAEAEAEAEEEEEAEEAEEEEAEADDTPLRPAAIPSEELPASESLATDELDQDDALANNAIVA